MGDCDATADYDYPRGVTLRAYEIREGALVRVSVPSRDGGPGSSFELRRDGEQVTLTPKAAASAWRLLLVRETFEAVSGCTVEATAEGSLVLPNSPETVAIAVRRSR
jgi:hypothetical protein